MPFVVIEDKALGPVDVGLLGAVGIVLVPYCSTHLVEQFVGSSCHANLQISVVAQGAELRYNPDWFCKEILHGILCRSFLESARCWCFHGAFLHNHLLSLLIWEHSVEVLVGRDASAASVLPNGARDFEQRRRLVATRPLPPPNCSMKPTLLPSPHCGATQLEGAAYFAPR
jgi:hypothetical protein